MTLPNPSTGDTIQATDITDIKNHLEGASTYTAPYHLRQSTGSFTITLPDAAGATKLRLNDSAGSEVFSVDSDGTITNSGTYAPAAITLPGSASPSPTTDGSIVWDTDDNNIAIGDGSSTQLFFPDNKGADLASATTLTTTGHFHHVTGTTTVTGIASRPSGVEVILYFVSGVPLTHNATSFILSQSASRTTVPGEIARFISEGSGNWREVTTGRTGRYALAANQSVTSSTTLVTCTGMTHAVVSGGVYYCKFIGAYEAGTTGDFKAGLLAPANSIGRIFNVYRVSGGVPTLSYTNDTDMSSVAEFSADGQGAATATMFILEALVTAGADGSLSFQFAQNTSNGTATIMYAGALFTVERTA